MCTTSYRCSGCDVVLKGIETQITKANQYKETQQRIQQNIDAEVTMNLPISCVTNLSSLKRILTRQISLSFQRIIIEQNVKR